MILRRKPLHIDRLHIQTITFNKGILGKDVVFFFPFLSVLLARLQRVKVILYKSYGGPLF